MIRLPTANQLEVIATQCNIMQSGSANAGPFLFGGEQQKLARLLCRDKVNKLLVLKGRQIGITTFMCLIDVMACIMNPGINVALVVHKQSVATELLKKCRGYLADLGISPILSNTTQISLANGSTIWATTAGGEASAADGKLATGVTYHLVHATELPLWPNQAAWDSLVAAARDALFILESTARGMGDRFSELWYKENDYAKVFFPVEEHESYQQSPTDISDQQWEEAQREYSFTSRSHAAWWYATLRASSGDIIKHLHNYPVLADHGFRSFAGRWIDVLPPILAHTLDREYKIFQTKLKHHRYIAGVDTSAGVGKDCSAIMVFDRTTRKLVATWRDDVASIKDIVRQMQVAQSLYGIDYFVIENNGIGKATVQEAAEVGLSIREHLATEDSKRLVLEATKKAVESGELAGPSELHQECSALHRDSKGKFKGPKDSIMACGFALLWLDRDPYHMPKIPNDQSVYDERALLEKRSSWKF